MAKIVLNETDETELKDGSNIQEACEESGVPFACTEGVCGTCVIEVEEGMENLNEYTEAEKEFLGETDNERLACQCRLEKGTLKVTF
jgi:ferredoxin